MTNQVELDSLVGEHVLDAVDTFTESVKQYGEQFESCEIIRFRLDGVVYTAIEDPDDGYRSSLGRLFVSTDEPMRNIFLPIRIMATKKSAREYVNDTLQFVDIANGKTVLEVGTDNTDDYYPWFVAFFDPTAMSTNEEPK